MKIYKAKRKGFINYLLIGFMALPFIFFYFDKDKFIEEPFLILLLVIPLILILWIYFDTSYKIENDKLIYRSGFLRGKIEIASITEIVKGKTMWSGIKPALATKGLIIKFNQYDEIYIAPENNDDILSDLLKVNPDIGITEPHKAQI